VIAVDTNILVYAHRLDSAFHSVANQKLTELAENVNAWGLPWPCIHEFLAIVTHPRIYKTPTPLDAALTQIEAWLESPTLHLIGELGDYWPILKALARQGKIIGPRIHDARIAALCLQNNVSLLWSSDRDFSRMEGLKVENPLVN